MRTKEFINKLEHDRVVRAIAAAEAKTSGEIRVFVQRGEVDDPITAAREQFEKLGMTATRDRNAILIFVAPRARKFAIIGDGGIHKRCGDGYWQELVEKMCQDFRAENFTDAITRAIGQTGDLLAKHFPRRRDDRNELPDTVEEA